MSNDTDRWYLSGPLSIGKKEPAKVGLHIGKDVPGGEARIQLDNVNKAYGQINRWTNRLEILASDAVEIAIGSIGNNTLRIEDRSVRVNGSLSTSGAFYAGNSDLYFTKTDHDHTCIGNTPGYAAIENSANYDTLMILGRMVGTSFPKRSVSVWDELNVHGDVIISGALSVERGDLRINDKNIWFRGGNDPYHGLGFHGSGKEFAGQNINGPVLYGNGGGGLGAKTGDQPEQEVLALRWNGDGDVSIGTATPENADGWGRVLDLKGPAGNAKLSVRSQAIDGRVLVHEAGWYGAQPGMIIGTKTAHALSFATNGVSRMEVDAGGNVSITGNLQVGGLSVADNFRADIRCADLYIGHSSRRGAPARALVDGGDTLHLNYVSADWKFVQIGGQLKDVDWASSREYKEDFSTLNADEALDLLNQLDPIRFTFKWDPHKEPKIGFISENAPRSIATSDGKGINLMSIVALLTRVVKQQQAILMGLRREI